MSESTTLPDIETRGDIERLMRAFYARVQKSPVIGYIFTDIAKTNWDHHIPLIVDFWETILLDRAVYRRNVMDIHYLLHRKEPFRKDFFDEWIMLFETTVNELYAGQRASLAIKRARGILALMEYRMLGEGGPGLSPR